MAGQSRRFAGIAGIAVVIASASTASAGDWPCYRADAARSGVTNEKLNLPLAPMWIHEALCPPAPAWPEPGKELHRLDFDYAFQPVVVGGMVYWGSSVDDTLRAASLQDGRIQWRFSAGGPFRFAPAVADGRVHAANDDGYLYCLDAQAGRLLWRFRAAPGDRQMLGNGRMISRWPCRSGVLVLDGVAYVTAGMWPAEGVFIHALEAATGRPLWQSAAGQQYINQPHEGASAFTGVTPQGYLLASGDLLLVPAGRTTPAAYDRRSGRQVYYQPYLSNSAGAGPFPDFQKSGGAWATIAGDLVLNPLHKGVGQPDAQVGECPPGRGDGLAAYELATGRPLLQLPGKHRCVVAGGILYAVGDGQVVAIDLARWQATKSAEAATKWSADHGRAYAMALAGDALLVGGAEGVTAFRAADGQRLWSATLGEQVRGLAVSDGRLIAATNTGAIVCFGPGPAGTVPARLRDVPESAPAPGARDVALAAEAIEIAGVREGYALVLGQADSSLAIALASQSRLHVVCVLDGAADVEGERERVLATGLYGARLVVEGVEDFARLPFASYFADLIVVAGKAKGIAGAEVYRVLRPCGGVLLVPPAMRDLGSRLVKQAAPPALEVCPSGQWTRILRGALPGAGEWRYTWADAGRTGVGGESLVRQPLELLWFGGPGPDRLMDRHFRGSGPLSVHGRVFLPGQHHIIALDAYNGRELWCRALEGVGRRLSSAFDGNVVADDDSVYAVIGTRCYRLDQASGEIRTIYRAPEFVSPVLEKGSGPFCRNGPAGASHKRVLTPFPAGQSRFRVEPWLYPSGWGYLAVTDELMLGSRMESALPGSATKARAMVFALSKSDGAVRWTRPAARTILNRAIVLGEDRLFVLDATDPDAIVAALRRGREVAIEQTLLALDLKTGRELWRQDDVPARQYGLQYTQGMVLIDATAAYDAQTGAKLWHRRFRTGNGPPMAIVGVPLDAWASGQRGGRFSPILRDWIVSTSAAYDLRTGRGMRMTAGLFSDSQRVWQYGRSKGCGPVAGCQTMLFFRSGTVGFLDLANEGLTTFGGVRPGCAVTMIAAGGLMLIPPGDSGCSCSYNFQTSLALVSAQAERDVWCVFQGTEPARPLEVLRVNLGAPGDRRDPDGAPWVSFPRPAAPRAVSVPMDIEGEAGWFDRPFHGAIAERGGPPWVYASGLRGEARLVVRLTPPCWKRGQDPFVRSTRRAVPAKRSCPLFQPPEADVEGATEPRQYVLRLHFAESDDLAPGKRVFDVRLGDAVLLEGFDIMREAGASRRAVVKEFNVRTGTSLEINLVARRTGAAQGLPPLLNGLEVILRSRVSDD